MTPDLTQSALWFFVVMAPVCLFVVYSDLKYMKIPNWTVLLMVVVFSVLGLMFLPASDLLWRYAHLGVVLVIGFLLSSAGVLGAGDAKFAAAAAPFVALSDVGTVLVLLAFMGPTALILHRMAGRFGLKDALPDWQSWQRTRDFPFGFPLAATLMLYLGILAFAG